MAGCCCKARSPCNTQPVRGERGAGGYHRGRAPVGGFYACPALLQTFQPGTLVDADPVTGIRTTVGQADGSSVHLVAESNAERRTLTYDLRSGCLTFSLTEQQHAGGAVTAQWLQLRHTW